jgi:flagellar hook assembly protein FlgD
MPAREPVKLRLYDVTGRLVRTLLDAPAGPGKVQTQWDGADDHGARVASGRYYYKLETSTSVQSKSLLLVR